MQGLSLLADLLIAGFAGWQVVETWHHGSIFREVRERLKTMRSDKTRSWLERKFYELFICPFCSSHWVCFGWATIMLSTDSDSFWRLPVYTFAITRVAQLLNDVTHSITRSPGDEEEIVVDETDQTSKYKVVDEKDDSVPS